MGYKIKNVHLQFLGPLERTGKVRFYMPFYGDLEYIGDGLFEITPHFGQPGISEKKRWYQFLDLTPGQPGSARVRVRQVYNHYNQVLKAQRKYEWAKRKLEELL